jgi:WD40 repeat protein
MDAFAFHPTLPLLALLGEGGRLQLLSINPTGIEVAIEATVVDGGDPGNNFTAPVGLSVAFHQRMPLLATVCANGLLKLWKCVGDRLGLQLTATSVRITSVNSFAFHPSLPLLAVICKDMNAKVWRVESDRITTAPILLQHACLVHSVAFHALLPLMATGCADTIARLWVVKPDGARMLCAARLKGHSCAVRCVAFHPWLPILATAGDDCAKLWHVTPDFKSTSCFTTLHFKLNIRSIAFHPQWPLLVVNGSSSCGAVELWC